MGFRGLGFACLRYIALGFLGFIADLEFRVLPVPGRPRAWGETCRKHAEGQAAASDKEEADEDDFPWRET